MLYMVYIEIPVEAGNCIDFEEGGLGKLFGLMMRQFKPQAAYIEAGTRNLFLVADFDVAQMTEIMLIASQIFPC